MFKANQKVTLIIGSMTFTRVVAEVVDGAVYLVGGGDAFDATTGFVWGGNAKRIVAA